MLVASTFLVVPMVSPTPAHAAGGLAGFTDTPSYGHKPDNQQVQKVASVLRYRTAQQQLAARTIAPRGGGSLSGKGNQAKSSRWEKTVGRLGRNYILQYMGAAAIVEAKGKLNPTEHQALRKLINRSNRVMNLVASLSKDSVARHGHMRAWKTRYHKAAEILITEIRRAAAELGGNEPPDKKTYNPHEDDYGMRNPADAAPIHFALQSIGEALDGRDLRIANPTDAPAEQITDATSDVAMALEKLLNQALGDMQGNIHGRR